MIRANFRSTAHHEVSSSVSISIRSKRAAKGASYTIYGYSRDSGPRRTKDQAVAKAQLQTSLSVPKTTITQSIKSVSERKWQQGSYAYEFDEDGILASCKYKEAELILEPVSLNFWRAPVDNDLETKCRLSQIAGDVHLKIKKEPRPCSNQLRASVKSSFKQKDIPANIQITTHIIQLQNTFSIR